jgi:hypothetical protein
MNNQNERLVDTIKNVKTSTVTNGFGALLRGCWKLFLIATVGVSIVGMVANSFKHDSQYLMIPLILALIELKSNKISNSFFGLFK